MGRIYCTCGYQGRARKKYKNPNGTTTKSQDSTRKDKHATAIYYCPECQKEE